jgi:hypothetical protein
VRLLQGGYSRTTALNSDSIKRFRKVAQLLLDKGADTDFPGVEWLDTLYAGVWSAETVQCILERNGFLSANHLLSAMTDTGPQAEAIVLVMLPYLTSEIAEEESDWFGNTLFCVAVIRGLEAVTKRCLDLGVDIRARDSDGKTALHHAAENRHLDIVKMLVRAGSDTSILDNQGNTPIEVAKRGINWCAPEELSCQHEIIRFLIERA